MQTNDAFYQVIEQRVRRELSCSAHDLSHVERVFKMACYLAKHEKADMDVIKTSSLLHDIARVREDEDTTGSIDHAMLGADMAAEILLEMGCDHEFIAKVKGVIQKHRYKGGNIPETIEEKIMFDADKLDIIGAVGLARSFMIAGEYGQDIYNNQNIDEYIKTNLIGVSLTGRIKDMKKHTPNIEFEIKVKNIPERLFTATAKSIALKRIEYMEKFFELLKEETNVNTY